MKIALTTDHAGFETIGELEDYIKSLGHECVNYGPKDFDPGDDYPKYMFPAALAVASGDCDLAVIMGGSGQGEAMAANRIKGIRCAVFYGPVLPVQAVDAEGNQSDDPFEIVKLSRQHNHANVLSLSNRFLTLDQMKQAIKIWLDTPYSDAERHVRRVRELDEF
jgi:ribose 5-phosphate isomerase B